MVPFSGVVLVDFEAFPVISSAAPTLAASTVGVHIRFSAVAWSATGDSVFSGIDTPKSTRHDMVNCSCHYRQATKAAS